MKLNTFKCIDALNGVGILQEASVQYCVTSPPYYRLRDYGVQSQYGQEDFVDAYVLNLINLFREVRRVLCTDGTLWLNLGDTYLNKQLMGIPWMVAFALQKDGWRLRQDIIWHKLNPMPEYVRDRCVKSHEYIFLFSKSERYLFNHKAIQSRLLRSSPKCFSEGKTRQPGSSDIAGMDNNAGRSSAYSVGGKKHRKFIASELKAHSFHKTRNAGGNVWHSVDGMANARSVWKIATEGSKENHFAAFPKEIPIRCISAGTKVGDLVLDPFAGTGTVLLAASMLERKYIGFDVNQEYVKIGQRRLRNFEGLFGRGDDFC